MLRGQQLKQLSPSAWLGQVGKRGPDAQSSSDVNNWLCLIRKPLGTCSHPSPSSLGRTVCMQLVRALITSTQQEWGVTPLRSLSKPACRVEQESLSAEERQVESRPLEMGRWRTQVGCVCFEHSLGPCPYWTACLCSMGTNYRLWVCTELLWGTLKTF